MTISIAARRKVVSLEFQKIAAYFAPSLPKTANWLQSSALNIQTGNTSKLAQSYFRRYKGFRREFCQNRPKMLLLFDQVDSILQIPKRVKFKTLQRLMAITDQSANATRTITQILQVFAPTLASIEQQFYGLCFVYELTVEGPYRDTLKFFYAWLEKRAGRRASLRRIATTQDAKRLIQNRVHAILFDGYANGHIRNSIAHGRFSLDISTNKIRFVDAQPGTNRVTYAKTFTMSAFRKKAEMMYSVPMMAKVIYDMKVLVPILLVNC